MESDNTFFILCLRGGKSLVGIFFKNWINVFVPAALVSSYELRRAACDPNWVDSAAIVALEADALLAAAIHRTPR